MPPHSAKLSPAGDCFRAPGCFFLQSLVLLAAAACGAAPAAAEPGWVHGTYAGGDFSLAQAGKVSPVRVDPADFDCVRLAAGLFADDLERVTGRRPAVMADAELPDGPAVLIGTLGRSALIDRLAAAGKLDAGRIAGQWESFLIAAVDGSLVIAGSDRRGTAFGVFELSRAIGVSPWSWWADVTPDHRDNLFVAAGTRKFGPPSVQYRGIFLNDEDWGLEPWAAKTFEPEVGNLGPRTYARICELLLRLKANTLWPAMHECSAPFNSQPENKLIADRYGIIMGSSHCEPLLRNNVGEWPKDDQAGFNFLANPEGVTRYWAERLQTNGRFENLYTIGMRGIHDGPMQGPSGAAQIVATLEKIFAVQRGLLAKYVNPDPAKVPQIFCAYKEVLDYFLKDLAVPPDVTVVFPDDNFGYLRYVPTPAEIAARPGGFGLYYHISYLGHPLSYVWLNTTPPALMWEELSKAYDHGIRKFWMLNVGDLKPGEIGIDFFLQLAWDIGKWDRGTLPGYLESFAAEQFGPAHSEEIARLLAGYYRLGYQRKPEHTQWSGLGQPPRPSEFAYADYGNEGRQRRAQYQDLAAAATALGAALPKAKQDAFFELAAYPVLGAAAANQRFVAAEMAALALRQGRADARDWAGVFADGTARLVAASDQYNQDLAGGKWRDMMEDDPLLDSRSYRNAVLTLPPNLSQPAPAGRSGIGVAIEGRAEPLRAGQAASVPGLDPYRPESRFLDVFAAGAASADWTIRSDCDWIQLRRGSQLALSAPSSWPRVPLSPGKETQLSGPGEFAVSVDWARAPRGAKRAGHLALADGTRTFQVEVPLDNPPQARPELLAGKFAESDGVVSIQADHFNRKTDRNGAAWQVIPGLGRTGDAVAVFPTTAPSVEVARAATDAPALHYDLYVFGSGPAILHCNLIPTLPLQNGQGLRFAVAVDDGAPQLVRITAGTGGDAGVSRAWQQNVLDNTTAAAVPLDFATAGAHTLTIYMVDPGVVLEKFVIDLGGLRPSYLGPPETRVAAR